MGQSRIASPTAYWLSIIGRLNPGWTAERASAHFRALSPSIMRATVAPAYHADFVKLYLANKLNAKPAGTGLSDLRSDYARPLWLLLATTGLVLLIACANLANLLLARASAREREVAVRLSIGASRARLIRQFLTEGLMLAGMGAALGLVLAQALSRGMVTLIATDRNPLELGVGLDPRVLGFTIALVFLTCALFALAPAFTATRLGSMNAMRAGSRASTSGRGRFDLRRILVATQVALSLMLLVGALLFVRTLHNLMAVDPGFRSEGLLVVNVDPGRFASNDERRAVVFSDLLDRIATRPGIVSAARVAMVPIGGGGWNDHVRLSPTEKHQIALINAVSTGYFRTMRTQLVAGREFDRTDTAASPKVAIVNRTFARKLFSGSNPVGRTFDIVGDEGAPDLVLRIVGLVGDTKYYDLREEFQSIVYLPVSQNGGPGTSTTYVLRAAAPLGDAMAGVKSAVAEVNPGIQIEFHVLEGYIRDSLLRERLMAMLSGAFGLLAAVLATVGLYGVIAYMVARRRKEIGVRIALGADRGRVIGLVLREAVLLLAAGLAAGCALTLVASRAATTLLFGLKPYDPITLIGAAALLAAVALAAAWLPARRAAALSPMTALREE